MSRPFPDTDALLYGLTRGGVLLTEDMQDGRIIEHRLTIRNPFRI